MIEIGIQNKKTTTVTRENTAQTLGTGTLPVYSSAAMVALMEQTAAESVESLVEEGNTTVGIGMDFQHLAPSKLGKTLVCISELCEIDGRKCVFQIEVSDEHGLVGKASHTRFVVNSTKFMKKASEN